jgi:hypothetical protein
MFEYYPENWKTPRMLEFPYERTIFLNIVYLLSGVLAKSGIRRAQV